jgi:hypothetical protein
VCFVVLKTISKLERTILTTLFLPVQETLTMRLYVDGFIDNEENMEPLLTNKHLNLQRKVQIFNAHSLTYALHPQYLGLPFLVIDHFHLI